MVTDVAGLQELAQLHDRIDQLLAELGVAIAANEVARAHDLRSRFDQALRTHFESEEKLLIPALARWSERDARLLVLEHRHLLRRWCELCAAMDRGAEISSNLRAFGYELKAHAENEDRVLNRFDGQRHTGNSG